MRSDNLLSGFGRSSAVPPFAGQLTGRLHAIDERQMRMTLLGGTTLAVVAIAAIMLWDGAGGGRLSAPLPTAPASNGFVIHDAAPAAAAATPVPAAKPAQSSNLDALMQKMRASTDTATVVVTSPPAVSAAPVSTTPAVPAHVAAPVAPVPPQPTPLLPVAVQWTNVSGQGVHWRFVRGARGFLLSIDLGGGQVADVHVQPAFQNLDTAAINARVEYLKATILQNFSSTSGTYSFARDGSVSVVR